MRSVAEAAVVAAVLLVLLLAVHFLTGCEAAYPVELAACNEESGTLCESIGCENRARAAKGRALRDVPAMCLADGGTR